MRQGRFEAEMPGQITLMPSARELREAKSLEDTTMLLHGFGIEDPEYAAPHLQQALDFLNQESGAYGRQIHIRLMSNEDFRDNPRHRFKLKEEVISEIEVDRLALENHTKWAFAYAVQMPRRLADAQSLEEYNAIKVATAEAYEKFHARYSRGQGSPARNMLAIALRRHWLKD